jgi:hypothetical protein
MRPITLSAMATLVLLAGCGNNPPVRTIGSTPVGSTIDGQVAATPESLGPGGINRNYYTGSDPNFPRGSTGGGGHRGP